MPTGRGPDPSEFENAFVIEDESGEPSRVGTPAPGEEKTGTMADKIPPTATAGEGSEADKGKETQGPTDVDLPAPAPAELPADVRARLRKLEKMETKYQGESPRICW